jgi:hypothetical protein
MSGGKLDCQEDALQSPTNLRDAVDVAIIQLARRQSPLSAVEKEPYRGAAHHVSHAGDLLGRFPDRFTSVIVGGAGLQPSVSDAPMRAVIAAAARSASPLRTSRIQALEAASGRRYWTA